MLSNVINFETNEYYRIACVFGFAPECLKSADANGFSKNKKKKKNTSNLGFYKKIKRD